MSVSNLLKAALCTACITFFISSCKKNDNPSGGGNVSGPDIDMYAVTTDNKLLMFNAASPKSILSQSSITGLQTGETILGIDFRPATGELYGVGSTSRIYVLDTKTGAARLIGGKSFTPAINGTFAGFDFNPTVDRIRLITSSNQNLRLNPESGAVMIVDGEIKGIANAKVNAAAYTNSKAGAATTILFDIDVMNDKLVKQDPPNDGVLVEVGSLGIDAEDAAGFDIAPDGTTALAALSVKGVSGLYKIDLGTGKASRIGDFSAMITGIAIPTEAVAYAISAANELLIFNPATPTPVVKPITGIQSGESVLGIDMRPLNGQLYALGSTSRLYTINASSGAATIVGSGPLSTILNGTDIGFDFNPVVDRIRVVTNNGQNLRLNPDDGAALVDGSISLAGAKISGAAYTNNFSGTTSTMLFDVDYETNKLYKQDPPNAGTLVEVGNLGVNVEAANGFDIGSKSGIAYGIFTVAGMQKIYTVNLTNGAATAGAAFPQAVKGFTIGLGF